MWLALAGLAAAADEGAWRVGALVGVGWDLPDAALPEGAVFDPGPALTLPIRRTLSPGADVRATVELWGATGRDTVAWTERVEGQDVRFVSDAHWSLATAARLGVGPEIALLPGRRVGPYVGADAGVAVVGSWHSFGGDTQALLDPAANDLDDPGNVDPYTLQAVPAAGATLGMRVGSPGRLAWEIELGYTVAFLPSAPLRKTPPALEASRSAYALDVMRLGLGVSIPSRDR